ncbi:ABC transporter [Microlunatus endophyticus]|uniref:ABC transporter n=1 Tax=Microlunatus endophyticus TaxID=1716077 RepID=A0A917W768_9ACTN|nr:ABC transporter ATP-binding protein [Microlunatus endophyticus]GGL72855.1 ABC transporter [Microlunatus endophyticus]
MTNAEIRADTRADIPAEDPADTDRAADQSGLRPSVASRLNAHGLTLAYDDRVISSDLDVVVPDRSFTVIVGANGCGKSTLLRALSRMIKPTAGAAYLDGKAITSLPSKEVARRLGLLPQSPIAPDGITVADLVARGRYPHQRLLRQWSRDDERIVTEALEATGTRELADRFVDELSGGQRQRVWVAMALAQQTDILLLDEPITFLDIAYQIDVLDLCADLHEQQGYTLVAVLHDLNHACRYATHLIAMKAGAIIAQGPPADIVTAGLVEEVFGLPCEVIDDPQSNTPLIVPIHRRNRADRHGSVTPIDTSTSKINTPKINTQMKDAE